MIAKTCRTAALAVLGLVACGDNLVTPHTSAAEEPRVLLEQAPSAPTRHVEGAGRQDGPRPGTDEHTLMNPGPSAIPRRTGAPTAPNLWDGR